MVAGEEDKSGNGNYKQQNVSHMDYEMQHLREKLCRLERMLSQKEKCGIRKTVDVVLEDEKNTTHTIPISEGVRNEEPFRKQIQDIEYSAEDYIRKIADFEQKLLKDENFSENDYYEHARKKLSIFEVYRNLEMLEEHRQYFYEEPAKLPELFQNNVGSEYEKKNHYGHFPCKKGKKEMIYGRTCDRNTKESDSSRVCSCDEYEHNSGLKSNRSKLNVSPETAHRQVPLKKPTCYCREISSSSEESEQSFYNCMHVPKDHFNEFSRGNHKDEDVESVSSSEDQTTCSEVSKCTCYCSKDHSHGESSETDSDCEVYENKKKIKPERFRGGLDVISPKTRKIMKYESNLKDQKDFPASANVSVDNFKLLKVEELREGLERLKVRNRNLRDFLDTLQDPINLMGKSSEANTICTQVSSCYTFDIARQTRSGLLTVVEVLKGKCRSKDAMIVALADGLKTRSDKKIKILDTEKDKILMQDKSLVWNGVIEEKDNGRKFTKKESAIGFIVFLMILISHVKRSEMISYLGAAKKILTESPFKLGLFINEAENFSIDFMSTYYQGFACSFESFVKYSVHWWANIIPQFNHWFVSYFAYFRQYIDVANDFLITNQSYVISSICVIFVGILLINIKTIWTNRLIGVKEFRKIYTSFMSFGVKLAHLLIYFCQQLLSSKIVWFTIGFYSQYLWNSLQTDFYQFLSSLKLYYIMKNTEHSLFQHSNETQEILESDCKLFDTFDYSWLVSIFSNKFQRFVQFTCYVLKNV